MKTFIALLLTSGSLVACSPTATIATHGDLESGDGGDSSIVQTADSAAVDARDVTVADVNRIPVNHVADNSECSPVAPPGNCTVGGSQTEPCRLDSECTGTNARCFNDGPIAGCHCSSDTCAHNSECTMGGPCACHGSPYLNGGNECVPGNCQVDSDCGANGYCSPTATSFCNILAGYYCHTPDDECTNDSDCSQGCVYDTTVHHWACVPEGTPICT